MARWTTIKVPHEVKMKVQEEAAKRNLAQWELIELAVSHLGELKQLRNANELDKTAYYIMKLSYSVSALKIEPTKENLEWLRKTAEQVSQRMNIDTSELVRAAENYMRKKDKKSIGVLNMAWKSVIKKLILKLAEEA